MSDVLKPGEKEARRAAKRQRAALEEQRRKEQLRAAEAEDEVKRRQAVGQRGGLRQSLLTGSELGQPTTPGTATQLGG